MMMSELFLAPDAYGEPTLWGHDAANPDAPAALLSRRDVPESWRDAVWNLLISGLANTNDWELLLAQFDASQDLLEQAIDTIARLKTAPKRATLGTEG